MERLDALKQSGPGMQAAPGEEWVSALMDGELEDDEARQALARLDKNGRALRAWVEYSLIGDAMRGCMVDSTRLDSRFRAALADEPTVLAPLPAPRDRRQPFYWMAAAAAVAAIAWSVVSVTPQPGPTVPLATTPPAPTTSASTTMAANELPTNEVMPYLAAHQDYAYALVTEPEIRLTQVSLREAGK